MKKTNSKRLTLRKFKKKSFLKKKQHTLRIIIKFNIKRTL